jgi:hypothetical protein
MARFVLPLLALVMVGCATTRQIQITTRPPDASISIDGVDRGKGQISEKFIFNGKTPTHEVRVSRLGYQQQPITLDKTFKSGALNVDLKPLQARITVNVTPVPATILIDGKPAAPARTQSVSKELEFTVDARNNWTTHTLTVERPGYERVERVIAWKDQEPVYNIQLEPRRKDLSITTNPPGATVSLDGEKLGTSPLSVQGRAFPVDPQTDEPVPQKLRVEKKGYDPVEVNIDWDEGKTDYTIEMAPKTKTVKIVTDPPGAVVSIAGHELERDKNGASIATLTFAPINANGDYPTYTAVVTKKTAGSEWEKQDLPIGWENGKQDYSVKLKEILTRPVSLMFPSLQRGDNGWEMAPQVIQTLAMKDVTEGGKKAPPVQLTRLPHGTQIDTLAVSPDGTQLLFIILNGTDKADFRSQMLAIRTDGSGGADYLNDGRSLEITPSYTPAGDQIVFASNRASRQLKVWEMSATGAPGITQLTSGETNDLWPSIDSDPKPRLYYQAMVDMRPDPRLYMTQLGTTTRTDLTQRGGAQPRVSPKADSVLFTHVNDKTGKRDIYMMPDRGGVGRNLTNTPDVDEFDPAWSKDGNRIAYVSNSAVDAERRQNYDIWVLDLTRPERPAQITTNGSWDDHPAWDPSGNAIYFRSNRGGDWGIWKIVAR